MELVRAQLLSFYFQSFEIFLARFCNLGEFFLRVSPTTSAVCASALEELKVLKVMLFTLPS